MGNLPVGVQMQLLRCLQEKKIRPVGSSSDREVDVRIVTATNENLLDAITKGLFREDLYHRINEFTIHVPPLRDRKGDIELYTNHFMAEANEELEKSIKAVSSEALSYLLQYSWPGNLRELRNVIRRAVLFCRGDEIIMDNLPRLCNKRFVSNISSTFKDEQISLARNPEK